MATPTENCHEHQVPGREAAHQAEYDRLVVARLPLDLIQPLPEKVRHVERLEQTTTALVFADDAGALRDILTAHKDQLAQPSIFWVAYAKANRGDLNRDSLWPILGEYGMRPIGQVSVDEAWSAMRFRPSRKARHPSRVGDSGAGRARR